MCIEVYPCSSYNKLYIQQNNKFWAGVYVWELNLYLLFALSDVSSQQCIFVYNICRKILLLKFKSEFSSVGRFIKVLYFHGKYLLRLTKALKVSLKILTG